MNEELVKKVLDCAKKNADTISNLIKSSAMLADMIIDIGKRLVKLETQQKEK